MRLTLEDFLFDGAGGDEAVDETVFLLAIAPHAGERLLVGGRVPVRVEENKPIGADKVETAAASFAAKEENKFGAVRVVEFVNELLAFGNIHGAIKAEDAVISGAAELVKNVEGLRVVAYEHDFVVRVLPDTGEHAVENLHFA